MNPLNYLVAAAVAASLFAFSARVEGQTTQVKSTLPSAYQYEAKPDHEAFAAFHPRKAPLPGNLLLRKGDRLAICGDSITEQKMYSRLIESYLTACVPELEVTVRQYGWSGEKADGFYNRMDQDCLTFAPTIATLAYGMNDSRYRPFDVNNGQRYRDYYSAIVQKFKQHGTRVVVGSPGCAGKIADWVQDRYGTLQQHNVNLCALRDIAIEVADQEQVAFADIFWPMLQAQVFAPKQHGATDERPYLVAGRDGIHPGWAGHVIMAWAMLRAMGLDGQIGTISIDMNTAIATASESHHVDSFADGTLTLTSSRYPFCASGELDDYNSIRSGMTLVPFAQDLNRFMLQVAVEPDTNWIVHWGDTQRTYSSEELAKGINLAWDFEKNPFCEAFDRVDAAVAAKQAYETEQVKRIFHGKEGKNNFAATVTKTEAVRKPLADAIANAMRPVTHTISIQQAKQ